MSHAMSQQALAPVSPNGREVVADQRTSPQDVAPLQEVAARVVSVARTVYETVRAALERLLEAIRHLISHLMLAILGAILKTLMRPLLTAALQAAIGSLNQQAKK